MSDLVETWVRRLTPPAHREEVLGDLAERCATPRQYRREALRTLPFVIGSRIRRTTHPLGALVGSVFLWAGIFWGFRQEHWLAAVIPTLLFTLVLALRDAYREQTIEGQVRTVALDMAYVALVVLLSQALLRWFAPQLALSPAALFGGFPVGLLVVGCARVQLPTGLQPAPFLRRLSLAQLRGEIDAYERIVRRAMRMELAACLLACLMFLVMAIFAPLPVAGTIGAVIGVAGCAFAAMFLRRHAWMRPIARDLPFSAALTAYRSDMQRRSALAQQMFWRYLVPVMLGPAVVATGTQLGRPGGLWRAGVAATACVAVALVFRLIPLGMARQSQRRIDQLAQVSEESLTPGT